MPKLTPNQLAAAINRHMELTTSEALHARCDELAELQQVMFMELVSFARDGATDEQITEMIVFLSIMQYLAEDFCKEMAKPVMMPEFRESVKRAMFWFKTLNTEDPDDMEQMLKNWLYGMERQSEPVIWAWVVNLLKKHDILTCSLNTAIVVTIYAVADVFSRRIANLE
jgi:hypothetical protein